MKLLPIVLLNLATATAAVVVYDQVRSDPASQDTVLERSDDDTADLLRRIEALEAEGGERAPALVAMGADDGLLERITALEASVEPRGAPAMRADDPATADGPTEDAGEAPPLFAAAEEPTNDDLARFRRLREAVARQDRMRKNAKRVNKAVDKLSIHLTKQQRAKLNAAFTDFEPAIGRIWGEAKAQAQATAKAGGEINRGEIVAATTALIQQEFVKTITDVIPQSDAESLAGELLGSGR